MECKYLLDMVGLRTM